MNNIGEKYLPIGTVVMLKEGTKRVMITGFCSMPADDEETMFDYAGCMYPEGFLSSDQTALFNHNQIETVYHLGLVDDEEKQFKTTLNALVEHMNNGDVEEDFVAPAAPVVEPVAPVTPVEPVEAPVPPVGPGLPGYAAPAPVEPVEAPVPPVGPGLPGYVAPTPVAPAAPVEPVAPVAAPNFMFDIDNF